MGSPLRGVPLERRLTVPADTSQLAAVRSHVRSLARSAGAAGELVEEFELVVSELTANVIEHSDNDEVTIVFERTATQWVLDVSNADGLAHLDEPASPDPEALTGRGLFIVHALMDAVEFVDLGGHEHIRCSKSIA